MVHFGCREATFPDVSIELWVKSNVPMVTSTDTSDTVSVGIVERDGRLARPSGRGRSHLHSSRTMFIKLLGVRNGQRLSSAMATP